MSAFHMIKSYPTDEPIGFNEIGKRSQKVGLKSSLTRSLQAHELALSILHIEPLI